MTEDRLPGGNGAGEPESVPKSEPAPVQAAGDSAKPSPQADPVYADEPLVLGAHHKLAVSIKEDDGKVYRLVLSFREFTTDEFLEWRRRHLRDIQPKREDDDTTEYTHLLMDFCYEIGCAILEGVDGVKASDSKRSIVDAVKDLRPKAVEALGMYAFFEYGQGKVVAAVGKSDEPSSSETPAGSAESTSEAAATS